MALTSGDRGSGVTELQKALDNAGFDPGKIDGIYGPKTASAVRAYQSSNDFPVTGEADDALLSGLGLAGATPDDGDGTNLTGDPVTGGGVDARYSMPPDGTVYNVAGVGVVVIYSVETLGDVDPLQVMYVVPEEHKDIKYLENTDLSALTQGGTISEEDFDLQFPRVLNGGLSVIVDDILQNSYSKWFEETLLSYSGYNRVALEDPQVRDILYQALIDGASVDELQAKLTDTDWWAASNDQSVTWDMATDVRRDEIMGTVGGQISEAWRSSWGIVPNLDDPEIQAIVLDVASGVITYGEAVNQIRDDAMADPRTPEAERKRDLNSREVDIENTRLELDKEGRMYGIAMTDAQLKEWSTGIVDKDTALTFEDWVGWARDSAENTFGSREAGTSTRGRNMSVKDWAAPHTESYATLMEVEDNVDLLFNTQVRQSLMDQTSVSDFRKTVRESDEWKSTDNARAGVLGSVGELSRLMGY